MSTRSTGGRIDHGDFESPPLAVRRRPPRPSLHATTTNDDESEPLMTLRASLTLRFTDTARDEPAVNDGKERVRSPGCCLGLATYRRGRRGPTCFT